MSESKRSSLQQQIEHAQKLCGEIPEERRKLIERDLEAMRQDRTADMLRRIAEVRK